MKEIVQAIYDSLVASDINNIDSIVLGPDFNVEEENVVVIRNVTSSGRVYNAFDTRVQEFSAELQIYSQDSVIASQIGESIINEFIDDGDFTHPVLTTGKIITINAGAEDLSEDPDRTDKGNVVWIYTIMLELVVHWN